MFSTRGEFKTCIPHEEDAVKRNNYTPYEVLLRAGFPYPEEIIAALEAESWGIYKTTKYNGNGEFV